MKPRKTRNAVFSNISAVLKDKLYRSEQAKGNSYWRWWLGRKLIVYVYEGKFVSNKLFIDAALVELKNVLAEVRGINCHQGTVPNSKFEFFQINRALPNDKNEYIGWKFDFADKSSLEKFLHVCESFEAGGLEAAKAEANKYDKRLATATTSNSIQKLRVGQTRFRAELLEYWKGCAITGVSIPAILKASHIKPWSASSSDERLDPYNGLLLTPNLDSLFDRGLITFESGGAIMISSRLQEADQVHLGISQNLKLRKINGAHKIYLEYHRENIYIP
jgi:hypothetical protein